MSDHDHQSCRVEDCEVCYPRVVPVEVGGAAEILDAFRPGWWREIDTKRLKADDDSDCVLGQLFGDPWQGLAALNLDRDQPAAYGFCYVTEVWRGGDSCHDDATEVWLAEIARRKADEVKDQVPLGIVA